MASIRGYIAASVDGYIADKTGGVDFLKPYETVDFGFAAFFAEIGTCVFGRLTYEQSLTFGPDWPYGDKRVIVVAREPLTRKLPNVEIWADPVDARFVRHLRGAVGGDAWIVGGARLQNALFDLDAIDRLQLTLVPQLLGDGVPLFTKSSQHHHLTVSGVSQFDKGLVMVDYRRG